MDALRRRLDPRYGPLAAVLVLLGGLGIHVVDQALHVRAGPVPILVSAPAVAVLTYSYLHPEPRLRRVVVLAGWGFAGSGLALLGVVYHALTYELPRALTAPEMVAYDLGLFVWFVGSLTVAYALAARFDDRGRRSVVAVLAGPVLQLIWVPLFVLVVEAGLVV